MISISELHKEFIVDDGKVVALNKLDIEINAGEFFVIVGASGSGKTTLLRSVAGLETPDSGKINEAWDREFLERWCSNDRNALLN